MGPIRLDKRICGTMDQWGGNFDSDVGCKHNKVADVEDAEIESKEVTLNVMSKMDAKHAKPDSLNPGFDKAFWGKAVPQRDTTGHGTLTRKLQD